MGQEHFYKNKKVILMKITKEQLSELIINEAASLGIPLGSSNRKQNKQPSEMKEFSLTKSGKKVSEAGKKIKSGGILIKEIAEDQTGKMRGTLNNISEFVEKLGATLESLQMLDENTSLTETLPTLQKFKQLHKSIQQLEK